jgi:hypothetical protein
MCYGISSFPQKSLTIRQRKQLGKDATLKQLIIAEFAEAAKQLDLFSVYSVFAVNLVGRTFDELSKHGGGDESIFLDEVLVLVGRLAESWHFFNLIKHTQ